MQAKMLKVILASTLGNMVELYDFTLYAILIPFFAAQFFPHEGGNDVALLLSLGVFAVAFFARPVGALIFGYIADKYGRRLSLLISIALMSGATISIGLLPTYAEIGIIAPIALVLLRVLQGLSVGGEFTSAAIFLIEFYSKRSGISSGLTIASSVIGAIIATLVGHAVMQSTAADAWRLPFIIGGMVALCGVYIRLLVEEAPAFRDAMQVNAPATYPLKEVFKGHLPEFLLLIGICGYSGAISYALIAYANVHLTVVLGLDKGEIGTYHLCGLAAFGIASIFFGYLADKIGAAKVLIGSTLAGIVCAVPVFVAFASQVPFLLIGGQVTLGLLAGSYCAPQLSYIAQFFPIRLRCSAIAFGHGLGMAILGGTFPAIAISLIKSSHHPLMAGYYLALCSLIGFVFLYISMALGLSNRHPDGAVNAFYEEN